MGAEKLRSIWASVFLTNTLSLPMLALLSAARGEFDGVAQSVHATPMAQWLVIAGSCVMGTAIGYAGWRLRDAVSATVCTTVGVANKIASVLLSAAFVNKAQPISWMGFGALLWCILAASQYKPAPPQSRKAE